MAQEGVFAFHKRGLSFAGHVLFGDMKVGVDGVIIACGDVDAVSFFQAESEGQVIAELPRFGYFKVNNLTSDPINSKPNVDAVAFFLQ
jgi:hypothetical protein